MTIEKAIKKITKSYDDYTEEYRKKVDGLEAIWIHKTDHADKYEVDEELIGVTKSGLIAWAYASGCSCWEGAYDTHEHPPETMKTFTFQHTDMKEEWEKKVIEFAEKM